ncbi:uncharacterized protein [Drosophila kikkawai]|nr:uncharacterized protein LOC108071384 [Drosophila kikkawai]XP_017017615.2 uncharacterized protein LOC108071384 [Drosophila kikkawai]XP_017017616.2 uncharacterized protein LOC108071384 [Drosophila kikkawai]XP_017017617.2 uncharacterized protein LOC108071384 [Drosophila kikkawai]
MVGSKYIGKLAAKKRKDLLRRCALKRPDYMEFEDEKAEAEAGPGKIENNESLELFCSVDHDYLLEAPAEPEYTLNPAQGTQPKDQVIELTRRVRALEEKLEANNKILEANTRELAESTRQVSKLTALLQLFLKGKTKDVAVDVSFPILNEEGLAALELNISPTTKKAYIQTITDILKYRTLPKSLKNVLAEEILCDFNIDGVNGKKSLKTFPKFFSVLIHSISMLENQGLPEKALAHALSCAKNNANKKKKKQINKDVHVKSRLRN